MRPRRNNRTPNNAVRFLEKKMGKLFIALLAPLWITAMTSIAGGQEKDLRTLNVNVFREDAAMAVGRVKGFFAAEGLKIDVSRTANSTDQMRGLSNGTYQIASTAFDNVLGWSGREGAELIAI